jgi:hypothetical protein
MIDYDFERREWLYSNTPPITGPAWNGKSIKYLNLHYTGGSGPYAGKSEQATLNSIQKDYQSNRGYSFGYSAAIGLSGMSYEGRGTTFRAASNGSGDNYGEDDPNIADNLEVFSVLLIIGVPDDISTGMIRAVRELYRAVGRELNRDLIINGHRDMGQTACPGDKAYKLITNKTFYPPTIIGNGNDMQTLRTPRRIIDTRETNSPVNGTRTFDLKSPTPNLVDAEITVTAIPTGPTSGFAGLNNKDSFINWNDKDVGKPLPETLSVPVTNNSVTLYFSNQCHVLITVRAEGT